MAYRKNPKASDTERAFNLGKFMPKINMDLKPPSLDVFKGKDKDGDGKPDGFNMGDLVPKMDVFKGKDKDGDGKPDGFSMGDLVPDFDIFKGKDKDGDGKPDGFSLGDLVPDFDIFNKDKKDGKDGEGSGDGAGANDQNKAPQDESLFHELVHYDIPAGDFIVQVHIIEGRGLQSRDISGTSDPVCVVRTFGQSRSTPGKSKTSNCVWDHVCFFEEENLQPEDIECGKLLISVYDANTFSGNELIGSFEFGLGYVYHQQSHEIWKTWIPLTDTTGKHDGVQGYLKVSVTVLGPGDTQKSHSEEEERVRDGKEVILMTPNITQEGHLLVMEVHCAENLPKVDSSGTCDAYLTATFAGNVTASTDYIEKQVNPIIGQAMEIPVVHPNMSDIIELALYDHEKIGSDRRLATTFIRYSDVLRNTEKGLHGPRWFNFYGAPVGESGKFAEKMANGKLQGSTYYGRVLLNLFDIKQKKPKLKVRKVSDIKNPASVATVPYKLRFDLYEIADVPLEDDKIQITLSWFNREYNSSVVKVKNGAATFYANLPEIELPMPSQKQSIPDVFIYLAKHPRIGDPKRVSYIRIPFRDVLPQENIPKWYTFVEDKVFNEFDKYVFPGSILCRITGGTAAEVANIPRMPCNEPRKERFVVRATFYQGRDLVAMDDNGFSDPYVIVKIGGDQLRTPTRFKTLNPVWNATVETELMLPIDPVYAPNLQVLVYDDDKLSKDDIIGRFHVSVAGLPIEAPKLPTWYNLQLDDTTIALGQILASFQVIPSAMKDQYPDTDLIPPTLPYKVEVTVVGLRDLQPVGLLPIMRPCIEFDIGDGAKKGRIRTEHSSKPSRNNPNFMKTFTLDITLPIYKAFAPTLTARVVDVRKISFFDSIIANTSIRLEDYIRYDSEGVLAQESSTESEGPLTPSAGRSAAQLDIGVDHGAGLGQNAPQSRAFKMPDVKMPDVKMPDVKMPDVKMPDLKMPDVKMPDVNISGAINRLTGKGQEANPGDIETGESQPLLGDKDSKSGFFSCFSCKSESQGSDEMRQPADKPYIDAKYNQEDFIPEYMKGRPIIGEELENKLSGSIFHEFPLFRGVALEDDTFSFLDENDFLVNIAHELFDDERKPVGKMKGFIRTYPADLPMPPPQFDMQKLLVPQKYIVRLYVLRGLNLVPEDRSGFSDPYLILELGKTKIKDVATRKEQTNDPEFFKCYELEATLPGASIIKISVMDHDIFGDDDLIGITEIDLETRIFSSQWKDYAKKPIEYRKIHPPCATTSRGRLEMWMDIIPKSEASKIPVLDISPPPKQDFELRVIIWKTRYVESEDSVTNQNDLYVTAQLGEGEKQKTDIHLRAKDGYGSFNYRMIFPAQLPMKNPRLQLAVWDFDIFKPNDIVGEAMLDLTDLFNATYYNRGAVTLLPETMWVDIFHPSKPTSRGQVQISVQVLPKAKAQLAPAGLGRETPNMNPVLDPPDRIKFDPFRPDLMLKELLGPELYGKLTKPLFIIFVIIVTLICIYVLSQILTIIGVFT